MDVSTRTHVFQLWLRYLWKTSTHIHIYIQPPITYHPILAWTNPAERRCRKISSNSPVATITNALKGTLLLERRHSVASIDSLPVIIPLHSPISQLSQKQPKFWMYTFFD